MTSSQWCFPLKVGVVVELLLKKSHSSKICDQSTAFLLTDHCLALPRAQSSHSLNVPVTWIPRALVVIQVMVLDGWPNSTWRSLMFFLGRAVADNALSLLESHRKLAPVTQPLDDIIGWCVDHDVVLIKSCFPVRACTLGKTSLHLPWGKTSQAIEYWPVQSHWLTTP